jgi:UDP-glucose 4-epimerase
MKADTTDRYYNVGTGRRTSLKQLAELIVEITGCTSQIHYAPRSQATLVRNRIGSPIRAREEIGFVARVDLRHGLERLIKWRDTHKAEVNDRRHSAGVSA